MGQRPGANSDNDYAWLAWERFSRPAILGGPGVESNPRSCPLPSFNIGTLAVSIPT